MLIKTCGKYFILKIAIFKLEWNKTINVKKNSVKNVILGSKMFL